MRTFLLLFTLTLLLQNPLFADYVVSDFSLADSSTLYICRATDSDQVEFFERGKRSAPSWTIGEYDSTFRSVKSQRKRWRKRYRNRKNQHGVEAQSTQKALRKYRKFQLLSRALRRCGKPLSVQANGGICEEVSASTPSLSSRIINGKECVQESSPVVKLNLRFRFSTGTCSGTVLTPNTVLTAAHCLENNPQSIDIVTGNGFIRTDEYISHPRYNKKAIYDIEKFDVALIYTDTPIPTATAELVNRPLASGDRALIAGFGIDEHDNYGPLRVGVIFIRNFFDKIEHNFDGNKNKTNTCFGDSGGPLFVEEEEGRRTVAGVTSNGILYSCGIGDTARYANLTYPPVRRFIDLNLE